MNEFEKFLWEDQRLVILRLLANVSSYTANSSVLHNGLLQIGHVISRDQIKTHMRWLEEQGLVTVEPVFDLLVARMTERGSDVAAGRTTVPGVKKPGA